MKIKYKSKIVPKGFIGITLWPFIFISEPKEDIIKKRGQKYHDVLINHEKIHIKQQLELFILTLLIFLVLYVFKIIPLWVIPLSYFSFYIIYVLNYIINGFTIKQDLYKNISFEREANGNENNLEYLKTRKLFSWIKYIKK